MSRKDQLIRNNVRSNGSTGGGSPDGAATESDGDATNWNAKARSIPILPNLFITTSFSIGIDCVRARLEWVTSLRGDVEGERIKSNYSETQLQIPPHDFHTTVSPFLEDGTFVETIDRSFTGRVIS